MKVILSAYNTCCQNASGGIQNRVRIFADLLSQKGIDVEFFNPFESKVENADILHVFMPGYENHDLVEFAKRKHVKVVLSTVIPTTVTFKKIIYKYFSLFPFPTTQKLLKNTLNKADVLITESNKEIDVIKRLYGTRNSRFELLPNGVFPITYNGNDIYSEIGKNCRYVLQVGRFDRNKNQLSVIKAMKGTGVDTVFIGGPDPNYLDYYNKCIEEAGNDDHLHFLGWVPSNSNLLNSAYSNCEVFVLPSYRESFGLVALEAGSAGAKLALSNTLPILEYDVFDKVPVFNPANIGEIKTVLLQSFNSESSCVLRDKINEYFNWDAIMDRLIEIYKSVL